MLSTKHKKLLKEAIDLLSQIRNERDNEWKERSDRWQESDKGKEHEELTEEVENTIDVLDGLDS